MTNLNYKIRKAGEKDYFSVNSLIREVYETERQALPSDYKSIPEILISYETFTYTLKDPASIILVAEVKTMVVGVIVVSIDKCIGDDLVKPYQRSSVEEFFVANIYASKGIEQALLDQVEQLLAKKDISQLAMVVYDFEKPKSNFLKDNGFEPYTIRYLKDI